MIQKLKNLWNTPSKTLPCPACKKAVAADVETCPKCGHDITDDERDTMIKRSLTINRGCLGCGGLIAVLIIIGIIGAEIDGKYSDSATFANAIAYHANSNGYNKPTVKKMSNYWAAIWSSPQSTAQVFANDSGEVTSLNFLFEAAPDYNSRELKKIVGRFWATASVADDELTFEESYELLSNLLAEISSNDPDTQTSQTRLGGMTYTCTTLPGAVMVSIRPKN